MPTDLLTYADVASSLRLSVSGVRKLVATRKLLCVRMWHRTVRFRPADVERALSARLRSDVLDL